MSADQQLALARATRGESSHLSKAAQKVVPPFLQKLYEIVNDVKNDELIRWSDSGDSFYVLNHERFAREVLGRWFKHQKFTSFVRQLNMYGFHKIPHLQQGVLRSDSDTEPWHFEHPHFHRGQPDLLCLIQRKRQPAHGAADDISLDMHEPGAAPATPMTNLTPGQVLDINSIMNGITAIKRHQQAISADLNELKSSNQHLWQEALAARERHKKHQDTINRILKFLAGVFGHTADTVKHDGAHEGANAIPRKRQRLMIGDINGRDKRKSVVEEVEDDDERHSVRSDGAPSTPTNRFISMDTPEVSVQSPRSPSIAPSENGPSITDITSTFRPTSAPPIRPSDAMSRASSDISKMSPAVAPPSLSTVPQPMQTDTLSPAALTNFANTQAPQANGDWSAVLQNMLNSPATLQKLMQALANQQNHPVMHPNPTEPNPAATPELNTPADPRIATHQLTPYDPAAFDFARFHTDIPPPPSAPTYPSTLAPSMLGPLIPKEDGPALEPLVESANRLQKTYHDASEIEADVDALQYSLSSLIHGLGLDAPTQQQQPHEPPIVNAPSHPMDSGGGVQSDPADFDFDAFLNELSSRNPAEGGYPDVTARYDPTGRLDDTTVGDATTEQLTAFLDDVSDSASLHNESLEFPPSTSGVKRKSDVAELPPQLLSTDGSGSKAKRKR